MNESQISAIATRCAAEHGIPLPILLGVIQVESGDSTWASRYEAHYRWTVNARTGRPLTLTATQARAGRAPDGFPAPDAGEVGYFSTADTEYVHQKTSWGAMQVIGAVAREHGFMHELPMLCDPQYGIDIGARHLARLHDRFGAQHGWAGALDAYNDGTARIERPVDYPHKVARTSPDAKALIFPKPDRAA
ncbi:MAG: hypothetical protein CMP08_07700 [Xanthomonadales bacterium]|nr:hypothetical protein [Xanthomonadales bacterium]|tara:strand:+ start:680 stop:1252 length:573 start_codon:yes stop_codon:yes gene_type:complete